MSIAEKLTTIAENVQKVYEAGKAAGGDSWYDTFWDVFQRNPTTGEVGKRSDYRQAFYSSAWNNITFKPKYNIIATNATSMFASADISGDFPELLESLGISIDWTSCTAHNSVFNSADRITRLGEIVLTSGGFSYAFGGMTALKQMKLKVSDLGNQTWSNAFTNNHQLEELIIEGVIGRNGFNVQWCPLTHDSLISIINALQDYSGDTSGTVYTVTLGESNLAKLTETELASIEAKGWIYA